MIINVSKSFHETIIITLSVRLRSDENTSPGYPVKYIMLKDYTTMLIAYKVFFTIKNHLRNREESD